MASARAIRVTRKILDVVERGLVPALVQGLLWGATCLALTPDSLSSWPMKPMEWLKGLVIGGGASNAAGSLFPTLVGPARLVSFVGWLMATAMRVMMTTEIRTARVEILEMATILNDFFLKFYVLV
ncbi:hypothetical protein F5Y02DRAFT_397034 [Annulohypoxylon stygium]|nr:hypothetical protein F5Y02DRAFT_397034 [Annulohypoxylon stygium]